LLFDADADPDPTFHLDADPDPDPSFQIKAQNLEKVLKWLIFQTCWLVICKLMQIRLRIQLTTLMRIRIRVFLFDEDPGADTGYPNDAYRCGSGSTTLRFIVISG
jgi:hypothetical protein